MLFALILDSKPFVPSTSVRHPQNQQKKGKRGKEEEKESFREYLAPTRPSHHHSSVVVTVTMPKLSGCICRHYEDIVFT
ncbi:hypothetical protein AAC387_Pa06g3202 [Persea americana]